MLQKESLPQKASLYNGLALAYVGDAVFELYVRKHLLSQGKTKANRLHQSATQYVSAKAQAKALEALVNKSMLTEKELEMVKRGRNAKISTAPKNTDLNIYRHSTGFESLIGFLFLDNNIERLEQITYAAFDILEGKEGDA